MVDLLRVADITTEPPCNGDPGHTGLLKVSRAEWWAGIREGKFPQPDNSLGVSFPNWPRPMIERLAAEGH